MMAMIATISSNLKYYNCLIFIAKQPRASTVNVGNTFQVNPPQLSARLKLQVEAI